VSDKQWSLLKIETVTLFGGCRIGVIKLVNFLFTMPTMTEGFLHICVGMTKQVVKVNRCLLYVGKQVEKSRKVHKNGADAYARRGRFVCSERQMPLTVRLESTLNKELSKEVLT
jgi:hypothetical protein